MKRFELYLHRHIELDGDIHSHLAKKLVASICKSEVDWNLAEKAALDAIRSLYIDFEISINFLFHELRLLYWDKVYDVIISRKSKICSNTCASMFCNTDIESLAENVNQCGPDAKELGAILRRTA